MQTWRNQLKYERHRRNLESLKRAKMNTDNNIARMVGCLYIIGTITHILTRVVTGSTRSSQDFLATISANGNPIALGALLILTGALALAMIPVIAYPVLRKYDQSLALGYVVFRGRLKPFSTWFPLSVGCCCCRSARYIKPEARMLPIYRLWPMCCGKQRSCKFTG